MDDNDLFFGEKVSELKGEKKKLVDKNHKMSSTEMVNEYLYIVICHLQILSKMDVGQRITRNQMKILSTSSDSPLTFSSPAISPVVSCLYLIFSIIIQVSITKPRKRRSLIKKDSFTIAEPEEKILTPKRPVNLIASYFVFLTGKLTKLFRFFLLPMQMLPRLPISMLIWNWTDFLLLRVGRSTERIKKDRECLFALRRSRALK